MGPDLVAAGLVLGSMRLRWGRAGLFGCAIGVLEASMSLGPLGLTMLLFTLVGALAGWVRHLIYADADRVALAFVFVGAVILRVGVTAVVGGGATAATLLLHALAAGASTTVLYWCAVRLVAVVIR